MKIQVSFWFVCVGFFAILLLISSCTKDSSLLTAGEEALLAENEEVEFEEDVSDEIIPIDLDVRVRNGALAFESATELRHATDVLSNVNLASRLAWEESIGFQSLRSVYEKVLNDFFDENAFDLELATRQYDSIIDFSNPAIPLKNHDLLLSSILSFDKIVYVGEAVGTFNRDGSFWVMDGDVDKLNEILQNPEAETNWDMGIVVFRNALGNKGTVEVKSCTTNADDDYLDSQTINNGTNRGSTQLSAEFRFSTSIIPINPTFFEYNATAYMSGRSFRRKTCGCGWKPYPDDHMFYWKIEIGQGFSGPITTYNGQETHFNNELATKIIFSDGGIRESGAAFNEQFYYLNEIKFDTRHTTDNLDLNGISYSCN